MESVIGRYQALRASQEERRKWYQTRNGQDAIAALLTIRDGETPSLTAAVDKASSTLQAQLGIFSPLRATMVRRLTAALLVAHGRNATSFLTAYHIARARLREARLPRGGHGEVFAILLHYLVTDGQTMSAAQARAMRDGYRDLKSARWWITNAHHYPFLAPDRHEDTPRRNAAKGLAIYSAMREHRLPGGSFGLAAALALSLLDTEPEEIAARYRAIYDAFKAEKLSTDRTRYVPLASLCHLEGEPRMHARTVAGLTKELKELRPRVHAPETIAVLLLLGACAEAGAARAAVGNALAIIAVQTAQIAAGAAAASAVVAAGGS